MAEWTMAPLGTPQLDYSDLDAAQAQNLAQYNAVRGKRGAIHPPDSDILIYSLVD